MSRTTPGRVEAIVALGAFLYFLSKAQPNAVWGGRTIGEALEAFQHITGLRPSELERAMEGDR